AGRARPPVRSFRRACGPARRPRPPAAERARRRSRPGPAGRRRAPGTRARASVVVGVGGEDAAVVAADAQLEALAIGVIGLGLPERAVAVQVVHAAIAGALHGRDRLVDADQRALGQAVEDLAAGRVDGDLVPAAVGTADLGLPQAVVVFQFAYIVVVGGLEDAGVLLGAKGGVGGAGRAGEQDRQGQGGKDGGTH